MSFQVSPDLVQTAAQNLANMHTTLEDASASIAAPTAGVAAAAEDQVSAGVAAFFSSFGQDYQALSAQTQAFHAQFVELLSAGANAYLSTEVANAEQALLSAVSAPGQGLPGAAAGASRAVEAVTSTVSAAQPAALPILAGGGTLSSLLGGLGAAAPVGSLLGGAAPVGPLLSGAAPVGSVLAGLGGGAPVGSVLSGVGGGAPVGSLLSSLSGGSLVSSLNGVVTALESGSAFSLLSGPSGAGLQALCSDIAALPGTLQAGGGALVPGLLHAGASTGGAAGAYQMLVDNTTSNLQLLGNTWNQVTLPTLLQASNTPYQIATALGTGNLLSALNMTGQVGLGFSNLMQQLTVPISLSLTSVSQSGTSLALGIGLPQLLAFDALGAPVNATSAVLATGGQIFDAIQTGNPLAATSALMDAPANIANALLNGDETLSLSLPLPGLSVTANVPFTGLLVPLRPLTVTATAPGLSLFNDVTVTGPPVGGLVPAVVNYAPELLAQAFTL